ncbi:Golgi SNAP receptor complex member 2 isoform X4 [Prionailurus bengalensis]|uniref:Golgi SNAP receptor complex member 2 isoform X4 n=1 Tax=Prionailurus bengalensis TaxID=37029 RepID=UPI001CA92D84|nr:Golgi SNAP receptor complex member 2 isoform X4 [Prionailurus bengalensis]
MMSSTCRLLSETSSIGDTQGSSRRDSERNFCLEPSPLTFLRCSEETSSTSGRSSEPQALSCTFSPPKMMRTLLMSLVSCLVAINEAKLISRCDLARVLHKEDLDGFEGYSLSDWLCLAFVESNFNLSKVNENADGSFDYGIFQINSHYWCNDYKSHSENICREDCKGLAGVSGWERTAEPRSSLNHQLCEKDCVWSRGNEELVRRSLWD